MKMNGTLDDLEIQDIPLQFDTTMNIGGDYETMAFPLERWDNGTVPMTPFQNDSFFFSAGDTDALANLFTELFNFSAWQYPVELPAAAVALLYPANVSQAVTGMADSINNFLRTRNATVAHGTIWDQDTYYSIKWIWITLPISLVLLSTIFLIVTSLVNTKHTAPLWKSGLLPYLFHGPGSEWWEDDERRELREGLLERNYDMEDRAKGIAARLRRAEEGETRFMRD